MKIVHTMSKKGDSPGAKRHYYSPKLKAQVVQQCRQDNASIAAVALTHSINANIVHRWLNEAKNAALLAPPSTDIRVDIRHGNSIITVAWPTAEVATCAAWLREWLQ